MFATGLPESHATQAMDKVKQAPGTAKKSLPEAVGVPGMAVIPPKLMQKILRGEFIDMHELLPETW
jgi:hypothetical protein